MMQILTYMSRLIKLQIDKKFENGRTALHEAALQGYVSIVKILLEFGADKDLSVSEKINDVYI